MQKFILKSGDEFAENEYFTFHDWQNITTVYHAHEGFYEFFLTYTPLKHYIEDEMTTLPAKTLCIIPPGIYHCLLGSDNKTLISNHFNFSIKTPNFVRFAEQHHYETDISKPFSFFLNDSEYAFLNELCKKMLLYSEDSAKKTLYMETFLNTALMLKNISAKLSYENKPDDYPAFIKRYIDDNITSNPQIAQLYKLVPISPPILIAQFKELTGTTIVQYLVKRKMDYACSLLKNTNYSLAIISEKIGYESVSHFIRNIKKQIGENPAKYRKLFENKMPPS